MSTYLVGDIHGCFNELCSLLDQVAFDPQQDRLWVTGDLVARGPDSLAVLRYLRQLGSAAQIVLGNHDIHLLAIHAGISRDKPKDRLTPLLQAPDADELIHWLRQQPLLQVDEPLRLVMTHAGMSPQWDLDTARRCAHEVETQLRSESYVEFLAAMYGDLPNSWSDSLSGLARWRFTTNALTRMRYCFADGALDMQCKDGLEDAPDGLQPWFVLPRRLSADYSIAFGHWATLEGKGAPTGIYPLDTGCCWGEKLTLLHWETQRYFTQPAY